MDTVTISLDRYKQLEAKEAIADKTKSVLIKTNYGYGYYYDIEKDEIMQSLNDRNKELEIQLNRYIEQDYKLQSDNERLKVINEALIEHKKTSFFNRLFNW